MMKKYLYTIATVLIFGMSANAQDTAKDKPKDAEPASKEKKDFDKKFRFGLRVAAQPTWFTSSDKNNPPKGAAFGTGFGLNMEFRMSDIVAFSTGIGADFEGGKYKFRDDTANHYQVAYWMDNTSQSFVSPQNGGVLTDLNTTNNTLYILKERSIKTTHITVPAILKLSTSEYSGMKYFGMFGLELAFRVKSIAKDSYSNSYTFDKNGLPKAGGESTQEGINLNKESATIPLRAGFNAGLGAEYRLGGSTAFFFSVNYFRSFTNLLKSESKNMIFNIDNSTGSVNQYSFVKQNYLLNAIRINVGILF